MPAPPSAQPGMGSGAALASLAGQGDRQGRRLPPPKGPVSQGASREEGSSCLCKPGPPHHCLTPSDLDKGHFCSHLGLCGPQESLGTLLLCHLPEIAQGPQIPPGNAIRHPCREESEGTAAPYPSSAQALGRPCRHIPSPPSVWATERRGEGRPVENKSPIPLGRGAWWKGPVEVNEPRAV